MSWRDIMGPTTGDPTPNIPTIPRNLPPTAPKANIGDIGNIGDKGLAPSRTPSDMDDTPHRLWFIADADGRCWSVSFTPPATLAEVEAAYPGATVEPEVEPAPAGPLAPDNEAIVMAWLDAIGEDDETTRAEVLARAASDPDALEFYRARAAEVGI